MHVVASLENDFEILCHFKTGSNSNITLARNVFQVHH